MIITVIKIFSLKKISDDSLIELSQLLNYQN